MPPTKYPTGDPRNLDYWPDVPGVQTQDYKPPDPNYSPDSSLGATTDSAAGQAYAAAMAATGLPLWQLVNQNAVAREGKGPPVVGFGPDGRPLPTLGLSPVGWAVGGLAVGAVLSAFVGYPWYYGAAVGAGGGYVFGLTRG